MKSMLRQVSEDEGALIYSALAFWCPGCEHIDSDGDRAGGLHLLPVNTTVKTPQWDWDGNLDSPTLAPSILTRTEYYTGPDSPPRLFVCHSFLRAGVFEFLGDCTHQYVAQFIPLPDLPDWVVEDLA